MVYNNPQDFAGLHNIIATFFFSFQIYCDFSAYSDMAIGLGRLFGIRLPLNFNSPYQATDVVDFWRRWHLTLSSFLRDYVYIPLGGSRGGWVFQTRNLLLTMLLALRSLPRSQLILVEKIKQ